MRTFSTGWRYRPLLGKRGSRILPSLTLALAAAATTFAAPPVRAAVDDNWVAHRIEGMLSEQNQERGRRGRGRSMADPDDDEDARPQRRPSRKHKGAARKPSDSQLASLGRDVPPAQLRPLSVIEWARPKTEVLLPAAPPTGEGPMLASLGRDFVAPPTSAAPGLTGDPIRWLATASTDCLAAPLRSVLIELAAAFGPMTIRWTCRSKQVNARVGGAKRSYHLTGNAVDFNMSANYRAILAFLKGNKLVGGLKHYGQGAFHIDTGPRRSW